MNPLDILGSLLQNGMGASTGRLERTLGSEQFGAPGAMPGGGGPGATYGGPAGMPGDTGGGLLDVLGKVLGPILGGGGGATGFPSRSGTPGMPAGAGAGGASPAADILKQIAGAVLGGGAGTGSPGAGATGAGAMAVLAGLAAKALGGATQRTGGIQQPRAAAQPTNADDLTAVLAGLRRVANAEEETLVQDVATLTVRAMINAAKADGRIDQQEAQRLVGKLQEDGLTAEEQRFVQEQIHKPMETDAIVPAVPNAQVAAQIYAASVMAIEADTAVEQRYLTELASKLGLNQQVVAYLHRSIGLA